MIGTGISLYGTLLASTAVGGGGGGDPIPPVNAEFYPSVDPVSFTATTGAIQFPEYNGRNTFSGSPAVQSQTVNDPRVAFQKAVGIYPASTVASQVIVVAELPVAKRVLNDAARNIFGNSSIQGAGESEGVPATSGAVGRFSVWLNRSFTRVYTKFPGGSTYVGPTVAQMPAIPERFVTASTNRIVSGAGQQTTTVVDRDNGTVYESDPATTAWGAINNSTVWNIGNSGFAVDDASLNSNYMRGAWPGGIEAIYVLSGATVSNEVLAQIATGGTRPQDVLPINNVIMAVEASGGTFVKPAWATADATAPAVKVGTTPLRHIPGRNRQSELGYVRPNAHQFEGYIHGLVPGQTVRDVPFSFDATGAVEVQVFNDGDGAVVRDWTALPHAAGVASGSIALPRGDRGWYRYRYRLAAQPDIGGHGYKFGVGYKIGVVGQSQMAYGLLGERLNYLTVHPDANATFVHSNGGTLGIVGGNARRDSSVAFANTWATLAGKIPVQLTDMSYPGSGTLELLYDTNTAGMSSRVRSWSLEQGKIDNYGKDYAALAWNWITNETSGSTYQMVWDRYAALFYGEQGATLPAPIDNSFAWSLEPGYRLIHLPAIRTNGIGTSNWQLPWALERGAVMGLPSMQAALRQGEGGHISSTHWGPSRFGKSVAFGLAHAAGIPGTPQNPYWTNPRLIAPDVFAVDFVPAAGGALADIAASDFMTLRHPWAWHEVPGDEGPWTISDPNVVQTKVGNSIHLTKVDGDWPAGIEIVYPRGGGRPTGFANPGFGDTVVRWFEGEAALAAGLPHEVWAQDPLGVGLPIAGQVNADGKWVEFLRYTTVPVPGSIHIDRTLLGAHQIAVVPASGAAVTSVSATFNGTPVTLGGSAATRTWTSTEPGTLVITAATSAGTLTRTVDVIGIALSPRINGDHTITVALPPGGTLVDVQNVYGDVPVTLGGSGATRTFTTTDTMAQGTAEVIVRWTDALGQPRTVTQKAAIARFGITSTAVGAHSMSINLPTFAVLNGATATFNGAPVTLGGSGATRTWTSTAPGTLALTATWTDRSGPATATRTWTIN